MHARLAIILSTIACAMALLAPTALAADASPPVALAPGETVVSHTSTSEKDSQYVIDLLTAVQGIKIGSEKTTLLVANSGTTHPIEIDYSEALAGASTIGASPRAGAGAATGEAAGAGAGNAAGAARSSGTAGTSGSSAGLGGISLGQIAALLLVLSVVSRVITIFRQLGGGRR